MNILQKGFKGAVIGLVLLVGTSVLPTSVAYAQMDYTDSGSCDLCGTTGFADTSYTDSYAPSTGYADTSYMDSYAPSTGYADTSYLDSYAPSTGYADTSYTDSYLPTTGYADTSYVDSYVPTTGYADTSYIDSYTPSYSYNNPSYSSGSGYGYTGGTGYSSGYGTNAYSTAGIGYSSGYSTKYSVTPGTGYTTPVSHSTTPTQNLTQVQTQTNSGQPIIINNNNNNTNTNTNNNTAPVTQVATTPVQHVVDYVYPTTQTYPTYTTYRTPIVASGVSLSQIPYTGFDFGPVGDAIYWMGLIAFAVAAAYLLVYYRGGAFSLATSLIGGRSKIAPVQFTDEVDAEAETVVEAPAVVNAHIASVMHNLPTASERHVTSDAMIVSHSKNGEVPRIVITRE